MGFFNRRSPLRCDRRLLSGSPPGCTALRTELRTWQPRRKRWTHWFAGALTKRRANLEPEHGGIPPR